MTMGFQRIAHRPNLLDEDDVLPVLQTWRNQGLRTALVTLIRVEGGAPRQAGAQMAVAEDGRYAGYLSGGCLEQAVALEAQDVIVRGVNRIVRYGKGSPYFDIKLPCGSGLDLYFDQALADAEIVRLLDLRRQRKSCILTMQLGERGVSAVAPVADPLPASHRDGDIFKRVYPAPIRLALIGNGPAMTGIATLAQATGLDLLAWSTDDATRDHLQAGGMSVAAEEPGLERIVASLDAASAAVVVFHDHDAEPRILHKLLQTPCFYLGVLGNHAVHRARLDALRALGATNGDLARLHAPVGSIPNAKSKATFAFGVLSEMLGVAKQRNLLA